MNHSQVHPGVTIVSTLGVTSPAEVSEIFKCGSSTSAGLPAAAPALGYSSSIHTAEITVRREGTMNWDNQMSSMLSAADSSVAKMRERLTSPGKFSKGGGVAGGGVGGGGGADLFPVRERTRDSAVDRPPALPPRAPLLLQQPSARLSPPVQWADLAAVQNQLQMQSQSIESLTQRLRDAERERQQQQHHIQMLQEEVQRLREESRDRDEAKRRQSPGAERRMEQWRREVGRELSSLRGHISRATSLGNLEESFSSKLHREELEHLRREVEQLKTRLRRQEEEAFLQEAEHRDARRQHERGYKLLEELTDSLRAQGAELAKAVSQEFNTRQEVHQIRTTVMQLKDDVMSLTLREHEPAPLLSASMSALVPEAVPPVPVPAGHGRGGQAGRAQADSDSEDFSLTPSLAEVSSDDLSWLDDRDPALHPNPRVRLSVQSRRSDLLGPGSDEEEEEEDEEGAEGDLDLLDDDLNPSLGSELCLQDL